MITFTRNLLLFILVSGMASASGLSVLITTDRDRVANGEAVVWNVLVSNEGSTAATGVDVRITLPQGMGFGGEFTPLVADHTAFNPQTIPSYSYDAGDTVPYYLANLAPGATELYQITLKPAAGTTDNTVFVMSARASSSNGISTGQNSASIVYHPDDGASFMISGGAIKMIPGVPINFVASYGYANSAPKQNSKIELNLPDGVTVVSASRGPNGYQVSGSTLSWDLQTISGVTDDFRFAIVYSGSGSAGSLTAITGSLKSGPNILSSSSWPVALTALHGLKTTIISPLITIAPGGSVVWQVRVANQSNITANEVILDVTLPDGMGYGLQFIPTKVSPDAFDRLPIYNSFYDAGTVVSFRVGNLSPGSTELFQIRLNPAFLYGDGRSFTMISRASSTNGVVAGESQGIVSFAGINQYRSIISAVAEQTVAEDTLLTIPGITISDIDTASSSFFLGAYSNNAILLPPGSISVSGSGASRAVTITPAANASGTAFVTLEAHDGATQYFKVTVNPVNDPPLISNLSNTTILEDGVTGPLAFSVSDVDTNVGLLTLTSASSNTALVPSGNIVFGGSGVSRVVTVNPVANQFGSATITVTASDGNSVVSKSFVLTVTAVNDTPVISNIADQQINEDTGTASIPFSISDVETALASLTLTKSSSNTTLIPNTNIILGGSGGSRTVTITPALNQFGTSTITLSVGDGAASKAVTFLVVVKPLNDAPTISNVANQSTNEDVATPAITFIVGDQDTPMTSLVVSAVSSNTILIPVANLIIGGSGASRTCTITPTPDLNGSTTITLTVSDGLLTSTNSFVLMVNPVNDPPLISNLSNTTILEDGVTGPIAFSISDVDTSIGLLTLTSASSNTALVPSGNIVFGGSSASRVVSVNPVANQFGSATITVTVSDGNSVVSKSFLLTVTSVNDIPVISNIADQQINEDTGTASIPFSISDVETALASLTLTKSSSNTTLIPNTNIILGGSGGSRTVTITPALNQFGTSTITLSVGDGVASKAVTFLVAVKPVNDAPTISNIANQSTNEDVATPAITFIVGDQDTPLTSVVVSAVSSNTLLIPAASVALGGSSASRTCTITPAPDQNGSTTITLTVSDGLLVSTDSFVLTVNPVNDAPVIFDLPNLSMTKNTTSAAIPFAVADLETAAASLTVTRASSNTTVLPLAGIILGGSGASRTVSLSPVATGTATVTLTVSDGNRTASDTFLLSVAVGLPVDAWRQTHFTVNANNPVMAGDLVDPDGDALVNILEYALGGNPVNAASAPTPIVSIASGRIALTFTRVLANTDLTYTVEAANDLGGPWANLARSAAGGVTAILLSGGTVAETGSGPTRVVEVRDAFLIGNQMQGKRFLRLSVSR